MQLEDSSPQSLFGGAELSPAELVRIRREKLARITLDSMLQFVGLLDARGTVLEINQVALDGVGIKLSAVEGRPFWETFWWQVSEEINATLRSSIARAALGETVRWDTPIYGRESGKETIVIDASLAPVFDEKGRVVYICAEGRDITEKKAQERELALKNIELQGLLERIKKLDQVKTQFFANVSHEFRTPLTLILGPLEDVLLAMPEDANRERLGLVHRNALRLQKLVNTLLDFSRLEAGRAQARVRPADLAVATEEMASNFRSACEKAGLELRVQCPPLPAPVHVDLEMWEKIVLNLLSNAFKFTLEGSISVELRPAGNEVALEVRDTGVGIPPEEVPRLFERFHQVEGVAGRSQEGSGIGLALVRELIHLHGGEVRAESELGKGTSFIVTLPYGNAHARPEPEASALSSSALRAAHYVEEALRWLPEVETEATAVEKPAAIIDAPLASALTRARGLEPRARIVIADDNADMRQYLVRLLADHFEVRAVADGEAALQLVRAWQPDLLVTDVMMPRLDGFGLLETLRADPEAQRLPVIMLSARAGEESRIEGLTAGADDYLVKPFSARELLARVDSHLKLARLRNETSTALLRSEERYRAIVESQAEMVCRFRPDGELLFVNAAYARTRQATPEALMGTNFWGFVNEQDRADIAALLDSLTPERPEVQIENRVQTAEGTRWTFWTNRGLVFDDAGKATEVQATGIDITERKQAEEAVQASERRFKSMADTAPAILAVTNARNECTFLSRAWLEYTGQPECESLGFGWVTSLHPEDRKRTRDGFLKASASQQPFELDHQLRRTDGQYRWHIASGRPYRDADNKFVGYIVCIFDVHERKLAEQMLQRSHSELEARVRERTLELEVRAEQLSRLSSALTLAEHRERQNLARVLHDHLQQLLVAAKMRIGLFLPNLAHSDRDSADHVVEWLDQAITASRSLTVELAPPILREADFGASLKWLARWMKEKHNLEVHVIENGCAIPGREDLYVLLFQSVRELLFNVVKHAGVREAQVTLEVVQEDLRLTICDQGRGFDPARRSVQRPLSDGGLGLFGLHERIVLLGGRLEIHSEPGAGTTVLLVAPLHGSPVAALPDKPHAQRPVLHSIEPVGEGSLARQAGTPMRLLIVDDHAVMRQGLIALLVAHADMHVVGEAVDGLEAIAQARALQPDVVIMDFSMPRMNGADATRIIREELPNIKIIAFSMFEEPEQSEAMMRAGAHAYRTKSGASQDLVDAIRAVVVGAEPGVQMH